MTSPRHVAGPDQLTDPDPGVTPDRIAGSEGVAGPDRVGGPDQRSGPDRPGIVRRSLATPGGPLAALTAGRAGPLVLLVPGYTGTKEDFLPVLAPLAAAGFQAVAYDQRGQFESVGPDDPARYTTAALADDLLTVAAGLVAATAGPVHVVGHSFGGLVARAAAIADRATVASLVLLCSGPAAIGGERRERMLALAPVLAAGGLPAVYEALAAIAEADPRRAAVPAALKDFLRRRFLASSPAGLLGMGDALHSEPDRVAELRATGLPVLVAHGVGDDAWPPAVQAEMAGRLGARYSPIETAAHSPAAENPAATVRVLVDFWSSLPDPPHRS